MRALSLSHSVEGSQAWVIHPQKMTRQRITLWSIPCPSNLPSPIGLPPAKRYTVIRHRAARDITQEIVPPAPLRNFDEAQHAERNSWTPRENLGDILRHPHKWYWVLDPTCACRWGFITGHHSTRKNRRLPAHTSAQARGKPPSPARYC